jgi:hypothetical protein
MNKYRKLILILAFLFIVLFTFFPPWIRTDRNNVDRPIGYAYLLSNPEKSTDSLLSNAPVTYRVDVIRLLEEWVCVAALAAILVFMKRSQQPAGAQESPTSHA